MEVDVHAIIKTTLPNALKDLEKSHRNITQIAEWCKNAYNADPNPEIFAKTQNYVRDALSNVAYHIHTVGLHLTNFMQLQTAEVDKLDLQLGTLTNVRNDLSFFTVLENEICSPCSWCQQLQEY